MPQYNALLCNTHRQYKEYSGFEMSMLREASRSLGFAYEVRNPTDRTWGRFDPPSGRWTGKRGMLLAGEVDLLVGGMAVTPGTIRVLGSSSPAFHRERMTWATRPPAARKDYLEIFRFVTCGGRGRAGRAEQSRAEDGFLKIKLVVNSKVYCRALQPPPKNIIG